MTTLTRGDRVMTPVGAGTVAYIRYDHLAPRDRPMPIAAVSVLLDRVDRPGYAGTIFAARNVTKLDR